MAALTDPELAFLIAGFAAVRADVDSEPFAHEQQWTGAAAVEARMNETQP